MTNNPWLSHYPESRFGGFSRVDGTVLFYARVNALLKDDATVVDIGCGKGSYVNAKSTFKRELRVLKGKCSRVIGIDVDESAADNPVVDEFRLIENSRWPLDDDSVDLCIAHYVLEHVQEPMEFFTECKRILKPGGIMCIRTPNAWGYPALAARLVPNKWHLKVLRKLSDGQREDAYPTYFRCNTTRKIRNQLDRHGFADSCVFTHTGEPTYLTFSRMLFSLGVMWHSIAPRLLQPEIHAFSRNASLRQRPSDHTIEYTEPATAESSVN